MVTKNLPASNTKKIQFLNKLRKQGWINPRPAMLKWRAFVTFYLHSYTSYKRGHFQAIRLSSYLNTKIPTNDIDFCLKATAFSRTLRNLKTSIGLKASTFLSEKDACRSVILTTRTACSCGT